MKITFSGSHSTGKTTILKELKKVKEFRDIEFISEITRRLPKNKINKNGDDGVQLKLLQFQKEIIMKDNFISDRGIFDVFSYTLYLEREGKISSEVMFEAFKTLFELAPQYDIVFYIPVEFGLVADGVRDMDKSFQLDIDKYIQHVIALFDSKFNLVTLTGDIHHRVHVCKTTIKQLKEVVL